MEQLPVYISLIFILSAVFTLWVLYKATHYSKPVIIISLLWLALQAAVSLKGFYTVTSTIPPRFALLLMPPLLLIVIRFSIKKMRVATDKLDAKLLTLLHIVRIPVEIGLYALFVHHTIPRIMTFEGRNFDILCGITAPLVYYFGYIKNILGKNVLIAWNIVCLLLLLNIVVTAVLLGPFPFQKFGFEQPDFALLYFPFVWLPCLIVPVVLFAHLVSLRQLLKQ